MIKYIYVVFFSERNEKHYRTGDLRKNLLLLAVLKNELTTNIKRGTKKGEGKKKKNYFVQNIKYFYVIALSNRKNNCTFFYEEFWAQIFSKAINEVKPSVLNI